MAVWEIRFFEGANNAGVGIYTGRFTADRLSYEIRNSDDGGLTVEIPLSATQLPDNTLPIVRDSFAPKRSLWELWRGTRFLGSGFVTSVNLNRDRDTILVSGRDWIWYLKQRIYPFYPEAYVTFDPDRPYMYATSDTQLATGNGNWPKRWPKGHVDPSNPLNNPVDVYQIVRDILRSMRRDIAVDSNNSGSVGDGPPALGVPNITFNRSATGTTTKYKIYPGDSTTIYDHIKQLSERNDGFEFDILPENLDFKMYVPRRDTSFGLATYAIQVQSVATYDPNIAAQQTTLEATGQIIDFDWTNDGPDATWLLGLGTRGKKIGRIWTDVDNVREFHRLDKVYDFGELSNSDHLLQMLKDQNDLHPQKKLNLKLLNPQDMTPGFYQGARPRALMGQRIRVQHDFAPYHRVSADFRINNVAIDVDDSTNEEVTLGLEMVYE